MAVGVNVYREEEAASFMRDLLERDLLHLNSNWPLFGLI